MQIISTEKGEKPPWSNYGGRFNSVEKLIKTNIRSPLFNYQRGISEVDNFIIRQNATEVMQMEVMRNGYFMHLQAKNASIYILLVKNELKNITIEAFKVKIEKEEKLAGNLTISINSEKLRFFVPAKNFKAVDNYFKQKHFKELYQLKIDPSPPVEQIKLLDVLSQFGKEEK
jgi:hypothetical protein